MKKVLSVLLVISILVGIMIPAFSASGEDTVSVIANAIHDLTIEKENTLPTEPDYNGTLALTGGTYTIQRDYAQAVQVAVKNTSKKNMEYYLTIENIYSDLYMNFVRNGSADSPLVIAPGETQQVQLDIFAQNAKGGKYTLPVYATLVDGTNEIKDAKTTLTVQCDSISLNLSCIEVSSSVYTLAKTMRLTNHGEALSDVTLSVEGDAADYVQLNPIVSNYQMERNVSVEFNVSPDLTKMKNNRVSVVSGDIIATSGGKTQSFSVVFDTKGQEIASMTMGQLAQKQKDNVHYNIEAIESSKKCDVEINDDSITITASCDFLFGDKKSQNATGKSTIKLFPATSDKSIPESTAKLLSIGKDGYSIHYQTIITHEEIEEFVDDYYPQNQSMVFASAEKADSKIDDGASGYLETLRDSGFDYVFEGLLDWHEDLGTISEYTNTTIGNHLAGISVASDAVDMATYIANPQHSTEGKILYGSLSVGTMILAVAAVALPGVGAGLVLGITALGLNLLKNYLEVNDNVDASITLDVEGHQCTNAGKITTIFYLDDYNSPSHPIQANIPVSGLSLTTQELVLNVGDSSVISVSIRPENATNKALNWETSNPEVATVSNGVVYAVGPGSVTISAKPVKGTGYDSVRLTVRQPVTDVRLNRNAFPNAQAGCTFALHATVLPENASNKRVTWSTSNPTIASVNESGIVTALAPGDAEITVRTVDGGYTATCTVNVAESGIIRITPESAVIPREQTTQFSVYSTRENVQIQSVAFSSDDPYIATVDASSGLATGVKNGAVTIVAVVETNTGSYVVTAGVQVTTPVYGVVIMGIGGVVTVGTCRSLGVGVLPSDAGNKNVTWSSSDNTVATVDQDGRVEIVGVGTVTITVTTEEGGFTDSVTYNVTEQDVQNLVKTSSNEKDTTSANITNSSISLHVTGRMFGGSYVNTTSTNYDYYLNGVNVGRSRNEGLTDLDIMELPVQNLKFGAVNTLVRDYDTNPGSHSVATDTQITITYPSDTPISYIGSPADLEDVRSLPDFAIYSENIFAKDTNIVKGNETTVSFNVYNRGSCGGWFNIAVTDSSGTVYSEENHYLDAFSGEKISFDWTPNSEKEDITVTLTNTSVCLDERTTENNTATRTFKARERVVPTIVSIAPDYAVEEEGIVFATVSNCDDVLKAEFYVDDVLYSGEVKTSVFGHQMKCWMNDPSMRKGSHTVKVVVTYATGSETSAQIEKTAALTVLEKGWDQFSFTLSTMFTNPVFYLYNAASDSYTRINNVQRSGSVCVYTMTKQVYDHISNYFICVATDQGFAFEAMQNSEEVMHPESCKKLQFVTDSNLKVKNLSVRTFGGYAMNAQLPYSDSLLFTPTVYQLSVQFTYLDELRTAEITVDLSKSDQIVDLTAYVSKYGFCFADPINGSVDVSMYYKNSGSNAWNSVEMRTSLDENMVTCMLASYSASLMDNADEVFICVSTDDLVFIQDVKPVVPSKKIITIDKEKLQKYELSASEAGSEFDVLEVSVTCDRFTKTLRCGEIYLTAGEYEILVTCRDSNDVNYIASEGKMKATEFVSAAKDVQNASELSVSWSLSYLETGAYVYGIGINGNTFGVDPYSMGETVAVDADRYAVKTQIVRNNSIYCVESMANIVSGKETLQIGDSFAGNIMNTFGHCTGKSTMRLYLDDLRDEFGNELTYFNSQDKADDLTGFVTLTNLQNPTDVYKIPISLNRISYVDFVLPNTEGTYSVSLAVSTTASVLRSVREIILEESAITIKCGQTYALNAHIIPENATNPTVVWTSSNSRIASVDENGVVTASKFLPGTVTISAITEDGNLMASCTVKVKYTWWQWLLWAIFGTAIFTAIMTIIF